MNPLLVLFGLDIGLLILAYRAGSLLGLLLVMGLCFAVALGLIVFSTAPPEPELLDGEMPSVFEPRFSAYAALER